MVNLQINAPEREIFKFRVMPLKDNVDSLPIGELIITNLRVMYKPRRRVKKGLTKEFAAPLSLIEVKYKKHKKGAKKRSHIIINNLKFALDIFDNNLVMKWLNQLKKLANKAKGEVFQVPTKVPAFIKVLEQQQEHMAAYLPPLPLSLLTKAKKEPILTKLPSESLATDDKITLSQKHPLSHQEFKECPLCSARITREAKFCLNCGNQIK